ncbi:unnamed protein product, partial [Mesorhabditis spiculigera]
MRSEANVLLSAMAIMDISLLICNIPYLLTVFPAMYIHPYFRRFYYATHVYFHASTNIFSAAASWLVLAVSLERYIGIRSPMHTRLQWNNSRVFLTICLIFMGACMVSFFHFFEHTYDYAQRDRPTTGMAAQCFRVFEYARLKITPEHRIFDSGPFYNITNRDVIGWAKAIQICFVVVVPLVLIPIFNLSIIHVLRNRDILVNRTYISAAPKAGEDFVRHYSEIGIRQRQERKVTATVVAIITCHIITHSPSALPFLWELLPSNPDGSDQPQFWYLNWMRPQKDLRFLLSNIINSVLLWGKVLNFVLFCLSSEHFRKRMLMMFRIHCKRPLLSHPNGYQAVGDICIE